jgi:uncharacterized protein with HEPN domain
MRDPRQRLRDILQAVANIERHAARGRSAFAQDELIQVWMVHHLSIIGEAAAQLGRAFHDAHPELPWPQIVAMRNVLVHEYFGIDLDEVWTTVERDLPMLKSAIQGLLRKNPRSRSTPKTPPPKLKKPGRKKKDGGE